MSYDKTPFFSRTEKTEKKSDKPLRRSIARRQTNQRPNITNDIIQLHTRKLNQLTSAITNIKEDEQVLVDQCTAWELQRTEFNQVERRMRTMIKSKTVTGMTALRANRGVLHDRLNTELLKIKMNEDRIIAIKDKTEYSDYLLDAIQYLNIHHALTSDIIRAKHTHKSTDLVSLQVKLQKLNEQTRINSYEYTKRFFPGLIRNIDKQVHTQTVDMIECVECKGEIGEIENSICVCLDCGLVAQVGYSMRDPSANLNWDDLKNAPGRQYTYRRLNHFREYLRQIQGKSRATIPLEIYEEVTAEFKKSMVRKELIKPTLVKTKLKKIGKSKWYEHAEAIAAKISTVYKPINIDPSHEEKLCLMFIQLEAPFEKIKHLVKKSRKNFLSYPFAYFKLNELNGWDAYNSNCVLLKSVTLINRQDKWWNLVMNELGWQVVGRTFDIHRE
jgi:hypothetical protein